MIVYPLDSKNSVKLAEKLAQFESMFHYPLGENETFTISHGPDYTAFYRSMGDATHLVAESMEDDILGVFCSTIRTIKKPKQKQDTGLSVSYLGDLKIVKNKQKSRLFYRFATTMKASVFHKAPLCVGIVMDGTNTDHLQPVERLGLPAFFPIGKRVILSIQTKTDISQQPIKQVDSKEAFTIFEKIVRQDYFIQSDNTLRSKLPPIWLVEHHQEACGKLEDTLLAKRLFNSEGQLIKSSHLSYFTFTSPRAGYQLILDALRISHDNRFKNLFVAMDEADYTLLHPYLEDLQYICAKATIFGNEQAQGLNLQINTAEI